MIMWKCDTIFLMKQTVIISQHSVFEYNSLKCINVSIVDFKNIYVQRVQNELFDLWSTDCVKDCKGKASGEYQSCKTCGGYVTCVWGILYERQCPAGLEWNDNLKVCDWPNAAGCALAG